jgi:DNA processing protein
VEGLWEHCRRAGIAVCWPGAPGFPTVLQQGPAPAGVLFSAGTVGDLDQLRRVAVVGTRRCTPDGADVAYRLGYDLAAAGVCVVSGLALGIDGAAHAGALAAARDAAGGGTAAGATVGVAASGVDVVYPRQHTGLWREVVRTGAVLSETPPGRPAQGWRFPSRNRLIAGLAEMVVVVECHAQGGSWHTVEAAIRCGVEVGAVPGPVRSDASVGSNRLLHEGATPVRGAQDVLDALRIFEGTPSGARAGRAAQGPETGPATSLDSMDQVVLGAVGWRPLCLDEIVERSRLPVTAVVVCLERLEGQGAVGGDGDWWVRRRR